jgi:diaminopimelate decarboxylase
MSELTYKKKELYLSDIKLNEIALKYKTPFFIYSESILKKNYDEFFLEAKEAELINPLICFALKSNSNKKLLKRLAIWGSGADIVSGGELRRAIESGIHPMKIVFSGVGKTEEEITYALSCSKDGIYSFNVESIEELKLINNIAKRLNKTARICFRFNPVVKSKTHRYISTGNKTHKFGLLEQDIMKALKTSALWTHSRLVGLSIHIGSQLLDLSATKEALKKLCALSLKSKTELDFIDVGGGLGVDYHPTEAEHLPSVKDYMKLISVTLEKYYYSQTNFRPRVVFEPGRRIIAKSGFFLMKVLRTKTSDLNHFVIVDGGMNDFMRPSLYEAYHEILPLKKSSSLHPTHVVGPICETSDCFGSNRMLPKLKSGDYILLRDTGAYGYSMGSNYNLRGKPLEILIKENNKIEVINPAQNYESLT